MKSCGLYRKLDGLGRFVVPMEMRKELGIKEGDALEIFQHRNMICLRKHYTGDKIAENLEILLDELDSDKCDIENKDEVRQTANRLIGLLDKNKKDK
jgi:transcriptional pleiotropic regulator of transition state genes